MIPPGPQSAQLPADVATLMVFSKHPQSLMEGEVNLKMTDESRTDARHDT